MSEIRETRRAAILLAACEEFCEKGYESARMEAIARRAGIGKSTVYEYFPSKLEITAAVSEWAVDQLSARIHDIFLPDRPLHEMICAYFTLMFEAARKMGGHMLTMHGDPAVVQIMHRNIQRITETIQQEAGDAIRRAQRRGEVSMGVTPQAITSLLLSLPGPQMLALWSESDSQQRIDELVDVLFTGFAPRQAADAKANG